MANQRFAVMVGVDDAGSLLRFAERDAEVMRDQFAAEGFETCLFTGVNATAGEIKATLRQAVMRSEKSDVLVVYFAGRTVTPEWSRGTDTYLITHDLDESALSENPD